MECFFKQITQDGARKYYIKDCRQITTIVASNIKFTIEENRGEGRVTKMNNMKLKERQRDEKIDSNKNRQGKKGRDHVQIDGSKLNIKPDDIYEDIDKEEGSGRERNRKSKRRQIKRENDQDI